MAHSRYLSGVSQLFGAVNKRRVLFLGLLILIVNSLDILGLSLFIPIIDLFQGQGANPTTPTLYLSKAITAMGLPPILPVFLVLLSVLFLVKGASMMWMRYLSVDIASGLQHQMRCRLFSGFLGATIAFIDDQRQGNLLSILSEHTVRASQAFFVFIQIIVQWMTALVYVVFVFLISWQLSLVALLLGLAMFPVIRWIGRQAHKYGHRLTYALEAAQHSSLEALQAKKLVNAMNWKQTLEHRYRDYSSAVRDSWKWMAFWSNSPGIIMQPLSVVILSVIIWLSLRFNLSVALLGAFVLAFIRLLPTMQAALTLGADFRAALPSIARVQDMLAQSERWQETSGGLPFVSLRTSIRLESVRFRYGNHDPILDGLTIEIPKGKTIAIAGPSGTGKTTIADLIMGLYKPESGRVVIDGIDLNELNLREYRSRIAYVPQEPVMFHDSIRNNLILGLEHEASDEELRRICELVGAWGFITQRKDGLDTLIGDRGVQLSGGQRQRLALARALLRKPDLLILDEATSALDHESEQLVKRALEKLRKSGEITIVVIAHRFATIQQADCIYQIMDGKAFNRGNWAQAEERLLMAKQDLELT